MFSTQFVFSKMLILFSQFRFFSKLNGIKKKGPYYTSNFLKEKHQ